MPCTDCIELKAEFAAQKALMVEWFNLFLKEMKSAENCATKFRQEVLRKLDFLEPSVGRSEQRGSDSTFHNLFQQHSPEEKHEGFFSDIIPEADGDIPSCDFGIVKVEEEQKELSETVSTFSYPAEVFLAEGNHSSQDLESPTFTLTTDVPPKKKARDPPKKKEPKASNFSLYFLHSHMQLTVSVHSNMAIVRSL